MSQQKSKEIVYLVLAVTLGAFLALGVSVWATSIGSNITSSGSISANGTFSATGLSTLSGGILVNNSTSTVTWLTTINATSTNATSTNLYVSGLFNADGSSNTFTALMSTSTQATSTYLGVTTHASTSALRVSNGVTFDGLSFTYTNISTTTIATNANAHAYATSSASIPLVKYDASNTRIGISTTTPGATLAVGGDGFAIIAGTGTSTLSVQSTQASRGGCIELRTTDGNNVVSLIATSSGNTVYWTAGGCR